MGKFAKKIIQTLELPKEVTGKDPKISLFGFNEILIENFKGIIEYEDFFVRIETYIGIVNINGFNIKLNQMNEDDILVSGIIENISFEKNNAGGGKNV